MAIPEGYREVRIGEEIREKDLYLSSSGKWEPSPVYNVIHRMGHVSYATTRPEPSKSASEMPEHNGKP